MHSCQWATKIAGNKNTDHVYIPIPVHQQLSLLNQLINSSSEVVSNSLLHISVFFWSWLYGWDHVLHIDLYYPLDINIMINFILLEMCMPYCITFLMLPSSSFYSIDLWYHFLSKIAVIFIIDVVGIMWVIMINITPLASNFFSTFHAHHLWTAISSSC